jgi:hypothetical protein
MQISFPDNLSISDIQILSSDLSSHPELYPSGSTLGKNYGNGTVTAIYPVVEGDDRPWNGGENHYLEVRVRPEKTGAFTFYVKTVAADSNWKVQAYDPGSGTRDQQNEYVNVYSFTVVPVTQTATTITSIMTSTPSTTTHGLVTSTVKIPTPTIPLSPVTTIIIIAILLLLLLTPAAATTATSKRTAITKAAPNIM